MRTGLKISAISAVVLIMMFVQYVAISNWGGRGWHDTEAWREFSKVPLYGSGRWFGPIQSVLLQPALGYIESTALPGGRRLALWLVSSEGSPDIFRFHVLFAIFNTLLWLIAAAVLLPLIGRFRRARLGDDGAAA